MGDHDRQETREQEDRAVCAIQLARARYREVVDQLAPPQPGSMLDLERAHTSREPLDTLVMAHRARATENLDRLFEMMLVDGSEQMFAYPYSQYSLIRTTVEAAATAMWLIQSSKKADRILRALQLAYRNSQEALQFAELLKGKNAAGRARAAEIRSTARLNELKNSVGPLRQVALTRPPRYTAILTAVSPKSGNRNIAGYAISSPLVVWKISSAFLHGSEQVIRTLSEIRQIEEFTDGVASFRITPNVQLLAVSIRTCVDLIADVDQRYGHLATHDYAGRPASN